MTVPKTDEKTLTHVEMLESLICAQFGKLEKSAKEDPKTGDFIRMVDLRRKLAPNESEQKQFWQMLEDFRRAALPAAKGTAASEKTKGTARKDGAEK